MVGLSLLISPPFLFFSRVFPSTPSSPPPPFPALPYLGPPDRKVLLSALSSLGTDELNVSAICSPRTYHQLSPLPLPRRPSRPLTLPPISFIFFPIEACVTSWRSGPKGLPFFFFRPFLLPPLLGKLILLSIPACFRRTPPLPLSRLF